MDYNELRNINGILNLVCAGGLLIMGVWLIWRGGHERPWWCPVPGRIVVGLFAVLYGIAQVEEALWRLYVSSPPGRVGRAINDWDTDLLLLGAAVMCVWSIVRFIRNDLEGE